MKRLKSILGIVLSMVMILSMMTISFARDEKTDAEMAEALDILKGDGNGITEAYLAKTSTRFQAAVMVLRLKGLEETAKAYEGTENFEDATEISWKPGQAMLAYLKAHPELGWVGSHNQFKPNDPISAKAYYKVMLELMGYEQDEDFEWVDVLDYAEDKGLVEVADEEELDNNQLAIATIEALQTVTKGNVVYINTLIEDEVVDADVAETLGLYEPPSPPIVAEMEDVFAIDVKTIKVDFDQLEEIRAEDFSITDENNNSFQVNDVELLDGELVAVLTVDELQMGEIYTIIYNDVELEFVPIMNEDKAEPKIESVQAITGELLRVVFDTRNIRKGNLVSDNFALSNDANVIGVTIDEDEMKKDGNYNKTVVLLDVENMKSGVAYKLKADSIQSYNRNEADFDTSSAVFAGKQNDSKAPKIDEVKSIWGYQVKIVFEESVKLDVDSATDVSNYTINNDINVLSAEILKNEIGGAHEVLLTTEHQKSGKAYTVKVNNISDGINVMSSSESAVFAGMNVPDNQELDYAKSLTGTSIEIAFKYDANDTAIDADHYSINNDISVVDVAFKIDDTTDKVDYSKVILTTTSMKSGKAYDIKVNEDVENKLGFGLKDTKNLVVAGKNADNKFTEEISASALNANTVVIEFDEKINKETATEIRNYKLVDLGYPAKAELSENGKKVILTVPTLKSGKAFTIVLNNLEDESGNEIDSNTKAIFAGKDK